MSLSLYVLSFVRVPLRLVCAEFCDGFRVPLRLVCAEFCDGLGCR